jgi:hypothetical protein
MFCDMVASSRALTAAPRAAATRSFCVQTEPLSASTRTIQAQTAIYFDPKEAVVLAIC